MRELLEERIGQGLSPYLQKSIRRVENGWALTFDPDEYLLSHAAIDGDHWKIWLASRCPALVVRGDESRVTEEAQLMEMAKLRDNTEYLVLQGGHSIHIDAATAFALAVIRFLDETEGNGTVETV